MDPSQRYFTEGTKKEWEKRLQYRCFPVNFAEVLRTLFLRRPPVASSGNECDETKQLHMRSRLNNCCLWMIHYELFVEPVEMNK